MKDISEIYTESILAGRKAAVDNKISEINTEVVTDWFNKSTNMRTYKRENILYVGKSYNYNTIQIKQAPPISIDKNTIELDKSNIKDYIDIVILDYKDKDFSKIKCLVDAIYGAIYIRNLVIRNCDISSLEGLPGYIIGRFTVTNCKNLKSLEGMPKEAKYVTAINNGAELDYKDIKKYCKIEKKNCVWS